MMRGVWLALTFVISGMGIIDSQGAGASESPQAFADWRGYDQGEVFKSSRGLMLPKALVDLIQEGYIRQYRESNPDAVEKDYEIISKYERGLLPVHLWLSPGSGRSVAGGVRFTPPDGGGEIDLKDYIFQGRGRFGLGLHVDLPKGVTAEQLRIYYVSHAQDRTVNKERFGSGCGKFYDITDFWRTQWVGKEIQLYTKDQRFISVIAGTYVFVSIQIPRIWLAALTLSDSRFKSLQCRTQRSSDS